MPQRNIIVSGSFDDVRSRHLRFLEQAARLGPVQALLWSDAAVEKFTGKAPKFSLAERKYYLDSVRYLSQVQVCDPPDADSLPFHAKADIWAMPEEEVTPAKAAWCQAHQIVCRPITAAEVAGFTPVSPDLILNPGHKKVIVTGCYDWFHTGHIRFFEEVSALGDLYVCVGNDANVENLKGKGHPLFREDERRFVAGAIRFVTQALITTGWGWLDAEPEIQRLHPDMYAVNEDGDKPEKRAYCEQHGIQYVVLKRVPKEGLPRRQSTDLRGF
jgi:cytidyltransferase-like protein